MEISLPKNIDAEKELNLTMEYFKAEGKKLLEGKYSAYYGNKGLLITFFEDKFRYGFIDIPADAYLELIRLDKKFRLEYRINET